MAEVVTKHHKLVNPPADFFPRYCRFKIKDDEIGKDDLAAWACIRLDRLQTGYRLIHLWDAFGNSSDGVLLVNIEKVLT